MRTTSIETNERDLAIVYGKYLPALEPREAALASVKYLYTDLTDIRKYYIRLGFHLDEFNRICGYADFGYASLEDFCEVNLGLDKSAVSRCINVFREFNAANVLTEDKGCAMQLADCWKDYSYTQLCELLPLSPKEREKVTPDMTIKQIREYKKSLKGNLEPIASTQLEETGAGLVASTQPDENRKFDYNKYIHKQGIVEQNYIKSCASLGSRGIYIFDERGRRILTNYCCEILENSKNADDSRLVIRLCGKFEPAVSARNESECDENEYM